MIMPPFRRPLVWMRMILGFSTTLPGQITPRFVNIADRVGLSYTGPAYAAAVAQAA